MKKLITLLGAFFLCLPVMAQTQIKGKVFDAYNNNPLAKANIRVGETDVTVTDENGTFSIPCSDSMSLTVSYVGYEPYTQSVKSCQTDLYIGLTPSYSNINEVEVTGNRPESHSNLKQAQSIGILTRKDLTRGEGVFLESSLNLISGVRMEKRTLNGGQRITIRGYGNGTNFNGTGTRTYLNGIPVTDAEGTTILDDVDFSTLGKVEVIKGPNSSLYGTGIGGVVKLYTRRPTYKGTQLTQEAQIGTFGLFGTNSRIENSTEKSSVMINYGHQNYDGYRINTQLRKDFVNFIGDFHSTEKQNVTVYGGYSYSYNDLAGQLTESSFYNKENVAEVPYLNNKAHVEFETFRSGVSHSYAFSKKLQNVTSLYFTGVKQSQASAAGLNSNAFQTYGSRTEFSVNLLQGRLKGIVGGEFIKTSSFRKTYALSMSIPTALNTDLEVAAMQYSGFTQWDLYLPYQFILTAGVSVNGVQYGLEDHALAAGHKDQSGYFTYDPVVIPRVALQKSITENISIFGNVSGGYSAPSASQTVAPTAVGGQVNTGLQPEKGWMYEIGSKGNLLSRRLTYQLALFRIDIQDKLSTQTGTLPTTPPSSYNYTVNAGTQYNQGLEIDLAYTLQNQGILSLVRPFVSFTYSDFNYQNFKSNNNNDGTTIDYSGNKVSGIAPIMFNAGIDIELTYGFYLYSSYQYVDVMPITYDNQRNAPSYYLVNAKIGYRKNIGKHFSFDIYGGGNNLTNSLYYNMVFLNQSSTGSPALYLPGAYTATFYGGLNLSYKF